MNGECVAPPVEREGGGGREGESDDGFGERAAPATSCSKLQVFEWTFEGKKKRKKTKK